MGISLFLAEQRNTDSARSLLLPANRLHLVYESARPNYAFERTGEPSARARVRQSKLFTPTARLKRLRPAAQRER